MVSVLVGIVDKQRKVYDDQNKFTGEILPVKTLCFTRQPSFREVAKGVITVKVNVKGADLIDKLPPLEVGAKYECDFGSFSGFETLKDIRKI